MTSAEPSPTSPLGLTGLVWSSIFAIYGMAIYRKRSVRCRSLLRKLGERGLTVLCQLTRDQALAASQAGLEAAVQVLLETEASCN